MKRCLTGALLVVLFALGFPVAVHSVSRETPVSHETTAPVQLETPPEASKPLTAAQERLKAAVEVAFGDNPRMVPVVACESQFRQFRADGSPLISPTQDVGVMQINIPTWGAKAAALGLDIYHSARDNIVMGQIVLLEQGIGAWTCAG